MSAATLEEILTRVNNAKAHITEQTSLASYLKSSSSATTLSSLIPAGQEGDKAQEKRDPLDILIMRDGKDTLGYLYIL